MYWPSFWLHIVNLCKIPFHLIGRTPYFCKELKFSFFGSPLQKRNGGSKNENFILKLNHIVRPIKWKGILHRLTIWSQKIGQYNSVESSLKMGLIFFPFWRLLKKRSVNDFILASYMLSHPNPTQQCGETHCYTIFHSDLGWKHSDGFSHQWPMQTQWSRFYFIVRRPISMH